MGEPLRCAKCASLPWLIFFDLFLMYLLLYPAFVVSSEFRFTERPQLAGLHKQSLVSNSFIDLNDSQWRMFRQNLPMFVCGAIAFIALSKLIEFSHNLLSSFHFQPTANNTTSTNSNQQKISARVYYLCFVGVCFSFYVHGYGALCLLLIVCVNFVAASALRHTRFLIPCTWAFGIFVLFLNEKHHGYRDILFSFHLHWGGLYPWEQGFKFVLLRIISFNMDWKWATENQNATVAPQMSKSLDKENNSESQQKEKQSKHDYDYHVTNAVDFSFPMYISFLFYIPLVLAGPICPYNAFASQIHERQSTHTNKDIAWQILRWIANFFLMETACSFVYPWAINGTPRVWKQLTLHQFFSNSYTTLNTMWLKFLLMWRMFRIWALADGIEVVDNMPKCVNNHYTLSGFWRNWHRSYNKWLLRYLYVPLGGGRKHKVLNLALVFTFVAIWHDITLKLLSWSWLTLLFFLPEQLALWIWSRVFNNSKKSENTNHNNDNNLENNTSNPANNNNTNLESVNKDYAENEEKWWQEQLRACGGAINVFGLMGANLVGFAFGLAGLDRLKWFAKNQTKHFIFVLASTLAIFHVNVLIMLRIQHWKDHRHAKTT